MKTTGKIMAMILAAVMLLMLVSCEKNDEPSETSGTGVTLETTGNEQNPEENYDGKLVFDHTMELTYAECFSVDYYKGGYKMITVTDGKTVQSKILIVPENMSVPSDLEDDVYVMHQPVANILVSSTPTVSLFHAIGMLDAVSLTIPG